MTITGGSTSGPRKFKIVGIDVIEANDEAGAADKLKHIISQMPWYKYLKLEEVKDST